MERLLLKERKVKMRSFPQTARTPSFQIAYNLIKFRFREEKLNYVLTGSVRQLFDSGDGYGDAVFSIMAEETKSNIWVCDIEQKHLDISAEVVKRYTDYLPQYVCGDSIEFLKNFNGEIDVLYLDSYDTDQNKQCCVHQVNEANAALKKMTDRSIIMIDDVGDDLKGGKAEFSIPFLKANGYDVIHHGYNQVILGHK